MQLFLRGTPGTGEDDRAGRVAGAHGAEEKQGKDKGHVCVRASGSLIHQDRVTVG